MNPSPEEIRQQFEKYSHLLLEKRNAQGFWEGRLSSSALGVAVAITALHFYDARENAPEISRGLQWLKENVNADDGFGDSPNSVSNVSTSLLCYAAVKVCRKSDEDEILLRKIAQYLGSQKIDVHSDELIPAILNFYKTDRTFSVPILTMCALCEVPGYEAFESIPQLPFEFSLLPRSLYRMLNLSVVSYAIPALVAVGIAIFKFKKRKNPFLRMVRSASVNKSLALLRRIQPQSGGYLEAIPLTAFVSLCLIESGYRGLEIVRDGMTFLKNSQRADGSWPIDVDLSTWVSTLAVKSLRLQLDEKISSTEKQLITDHFLSIQNKIIHPFNGTQPGGWGWTSHSGSVPDCDDTPGTILALFALNLHNSELIQKPVSEACNWLFGLQNSDGGFPTFSKGWGKLPFDQSCADLTGHAVLALAKVDAVLHAKLISSEHDRLKKSFVRAITYLEKYQHKNGFWLPLWFGNQHTGDHTNPVYGTARVVSYLNEALETPLGIEYKIILNLMIERGCRYLASVQNGDKSWGGAKDIHGSIEETSLAITALIKNGYREECISALGWLDEKIKSEGMIASPIGLYFASLWYDEELYPSTAYVECLGTVSEMMISE